MSPGGRGRRPTGNASGPYRRPDPFDRHAPYDEDRSDYDDGYGQQAPPPAPPPPAPTEAESQADQIQRLADLHASGALTDEEFAAAKAKALGI